MQALGPAESQALSRCDPKPCEIRAEFRRRYREGHAFDAVLSLSLSDWKARCKFISYEMDQFAIANR
jgi:hypothetical protein